MDRVHGAAQGLSECGKTSGGVTLVAQLQGRKEDGDNGGRRAGRDLMHATMKERVALRRATAEWRSYSSGRTERERAEGKSTKERAWCITGAEGGKEREAGREAGLAEVLWQVPSKERRGQ